MNLDEDDGDDSDSVYVEDGGEDRNNGEIENKDDSQGPTNAVKRGRAHLITPRLAAALDSAQVTDGKAVHILIAAAEALGCPVRDLAINRSTIHRQRQIYRREGLENNKENLIDDVN